MQIAQTELNKMKIYIYTYFTALLLVLLFFFIGCASKKNIEQKEVEKKEIINSSNLNQKDIDKDSCFSASFLASDEVEYVELSKWTDTITKCEKTSYFRQKLNNQKEAIEKINNTEKEKVFVKTTDTIYINSSTIQKTEKENFSFWNSLGKVSFVLSILCFVLVLLFQYLKNR